MIYFVKGLKNSFLSAHSSHKEKSLKKGKKYIWHRMNTQYNKKDWS